MIELADVYAAWRRIRPHLHETPVVTSKRLDAETGKSLYFKAEPFQKTGSFKARGALNKALLLKRPRGLVAASSGNHAQGVAFAARVLGVPAVIVMPEDAVAVKKEAVRAYGAELVTEGVTVENREQLARRIAEERGFSFIHPFDDEAVMAGQGTLGLELMSQTPNPEAVLVPVGGGGLISGVATAVKALDPGVRVIGVEPAAAADAATSFARGERVCLKEAPRTIADGVRTLCLGKYTFPVIQKRVDAILTVSEEAIREAQARFITRTKVFAEPTGVLPLAAVLEHGDALPQRLALVVSGGNGVPPRV